MEFDQIDTTIPALGERKIPSPLKSREGGQAFQRYVSDDKKVVIDVDLDNLLKTIKKGTDLQVFELAGPRDHIYFDPSKLKCALVTCGGLCPGLNDIIRSIVFQLYHCYGVRNILGIRYGLQGFIPEYGHEVLELTP